MSIPPRSPMAASRRRAHALSVSLFAVAVLAAMPSRTPAAGTVPAQDSVTKAAPDCVTIGTPKPTAVYTYRLTQSTGSVSQYTQQWEAVTPTGSKVRVNGSRGIEIQTNEHRIVNDAMVLDRSTKRNANGGVIEATAFRPGIVGDPAFRACAGRSWTIPSVTASYQSTTAKASSATPAGTLRIVAIRERVIVPAGTFDAVRYVRTSQSSDEYWKSIEHGVIVKHIGRLPNGLVTEELLAIK